MTGFGVVQKLLAEVAFCGGEAIIKAVEIGESEAPVEMIGLDGVGSSFNVEGSLVYLKRVWHFGVSGGQITVRERAGSADVHTQIHPAINLDVGFLPPVTMGSGLQGSCQRVSSRVVIPDIDGAAHGPQCERIRRAVHRRGIAAELRRITGAGGGMPIV